MEVIKTCDWIWNEIKIEIEKYVILGKPTVSGTRNGNCTKPAPCAPNTQPALIPNQFAIYHSDAIIKLAQTVKQKRTIGDLCVGVSGRGFIDQDLSHR